MNKVSFNVVAVSDTIIRPSNTTAYAAGDVISEVTTNDHHTFTILRTKPSDEPLYSATVERASVSSSANQSTLPDLELWLFSSDIAEVADNGAFAPTDAELLTCLGVIDFPVSLWKVGNAGSGADGNSICFAENLAMVVKGSSGNIYGQLVVRNAYTPVSAESFKVTLYVQQD